MCLDGASYSAMATALGCFNRDIAKTKAVIAAQSVTKESFIRLSPSFSGTIAFCGNGSFINRTFISWRNA